MEQIVTRWQAEQLLGLTAPYTRSELRSRARALYKEWHPDAAAAHGHTDPLEAAGMFDCVHDAEEILLPLFEGMAADWRLTPADAGGFTPDPYDPYAGSYDEADYDAYAYETSAGTAEEDDFNYNYDYDHDNYGPYADPEQSADYGTGSSERRAEPKQASGPAPGSEPTRYARRRRWILALIFGISGGLSFMGDPLDLSPGDFGVFLALILISYIPVLFLDLIIGLVSLLLEAIIRPLRRRDSTTRAVLWIALIGFLIWSAYSGNGFEQLGNALCGFFQSTL